MKVILEVIAKACALKGQPSKVAVFGILKRGGQVYTQIILDAKIDTLMPIIAKKIVPDSIVYTDCWRGYKALDFSEFKHFRINHSILFANEKNHINGTENFWSQAKRHMRKFNSSSKRAFQFILERM